MKVNKLISVLVLAAVIPLFYSCKQNTEDTTQNNNSKIDEAEKKDDSDKSTESENQNASEQPIEPVVVVKAPQYFWGTWQRMDNGSYYTIDETSVTNGTHKYSISSSSENTLAVSELGTFEKQSDSVMLNGAIPYFRKGGTNLEYTMKLVGFEDNLDRAASGLNLSGYKISSRSNKYTSYSSEAESGEDGTVTLKAPVSGDVQTVTVTKNDNTVVIIPGIIIENNGANLGTIPISSKGQYCLKVTGTIDESEKDDGYLYGSNYKSYPMTLTIMNIGDVESEPSAISITPQNELIKIQSTDGSNLNLITVSTLKPGVTKTINLTVECGAMLEPYIDSGLNVAITNLETGNTWIDFVPLRFYRGLCPLTVAAKSTEGNADAALNGFLIYPDGNSQFFSVPDGGDKTLFVPTFGSEQKMLLSFSGASVEGSLNSSTEMFYTVNPGSQEVLNITIPETLEQLRNFYNFGEPNNLETTAYSVEQNLTAYLKDKDIDFYKVIADTDEEILPTGQIYRITYVNQKGEAPQMVRITEGLPLKNEHIPSLADIENYSFDGWYIGGYKVSSDYKVNSNITLTAKWIPVEYTIEYELNGGTNAAENPSTYTIESETIELAAPSREGFTFKGWYTQEDYTEEPVSSITSGSSGAKKYYAKWTANTYELLYHLDGGTNAASNPQSYVYSDNPEDTIILNNPTKEKYVFEGWFLDSSFNGNAVTTISKKNAAHIDLYAKWELGFYVTSENISLLDLSTCQYNFTLVVTGDINENILNQLAEKMQYAVKDISLDLSRATGMTIIKGSDYHSIFGNCNNLKSIILPDCLETLGVYAFFNCSSLTTITIPDSVTTICDSAFSYCSSLTTITIPDSVTTIGVYAFYKCSSLTTITIPDSVTTIDDCAFENCSSLTTITIPDSVTTIGDCAFENCSNLMSVYFNYDSKWYYYIGSAKRTINVSSPSTNASNLKSTFSGYTWYKER